MTENAVFFKLTPGQAKKLAYLFQLADSDFERDRPGGIFAQIFENRTIFIKYLDHETAQKVQKATGVQA